MEGEAKAEEEVDYIEEALKDLDDFSISDIPEDTSSEKHCQTPYPNSSRTTSSLISEDVVSSSKPFVVTSATPQISLIEDLSKTVTLTHQLQEAIHQPKDTWIQLELPCLSTDPGSLITKESAGQMNRYESDEKDAGAHRIQLIDQHEQTQETSLIIREPELSWCSFYAISKMIGLMLVIAGLISIVIYAVGSKEHVAVSTTSTTTVFSSTTTTFAKRDTPWSLPPETDPPTRMLTMTTTEKYIADTANNTSN